MSMQAGCPFHSQLPAPALAANATLKVIGLGGVGSIVGRYLAVFLAALDQALRLVLVDGDDYEETNATRQLFARAGNKAQVTREELLDRFAGSKLTIDAIEEYITPDNVNEMILEDDIVLAAVDNHKSRLLLTERCSQLDNVILISGGNDGVGVDTENGDTENGDTENGGNRPQRGSMGSVQVYLRRGGKDVTPPLTRYHPEIAKPQDRRPDELNCVEALQSQPQLLFTNMMTATCILNTLMLHVCDDALHYSDLSFDVADGVMRPVVSIAPGVSGAPDAADRTAQR